MFWSGLKKKNGKRSYKDLKSHVLVGKEPLCAFMNRDHLLADKEEIYLEDLIPYTLLFPRGNAITKKNVLKNAKEKAGIELRLEEIPYSLILHISIYEGYCRCDTGKCVPICRFSGINL